MWRPFLGVFVVIQGAIHISCMLWVGQPDCKTCTSRPSQTNMSLGVSISLCRVSGLLLWIIVFDMGFWRLFLVYGWISPCFCSQRYFSLFFGNTSVVSRTTGVLAVTILSSSRNPKIVVDCNVFILSKVAVLMAKPPVAYGSVIRGKVGYGARPM